MKPPQTLDIVRTNVASEVDPEEVVASGTVWPDGGVTVKWPDRRVAKFYPSLNVLRAEFYGTAYEVRLTGDDDGEA
jgi:hypothetical protein